MSIGVAERLRAAGDNWRADAACARMDPAAFDDEDGGSTSTMNPKQACLTQCTVRQECLELAIANNERFGIWGGMSTRERDREVERRREAETAAANQLISRRNRMIISMHDSGDDITFIAEIVGVEPSTVQQVIDVHGITSLG